MLYSVRVSAAMLRAQYRYVLRGPLINAALIKNDQNCNGNDFCLCKPATVAAITACQQCMFNDLIARFAQTTDPRAGSATALTGP